MRVSINNCGPLLAAANVPALLFGPGSCTAEVVSLTVVIDVLRIRKFILS
ncbi:hypothetical protein Fuma_04573 [Fuerstiella marisgermanici]|uniref:Uncharacterized protein n=1 Tax=Fuerstiella marisgermanici TaxID=1891926 RepID=A0A1P8WLI5_9PLAN|nr:hypothetical protein Fuma_04573 [Fuerstiella marisgermanici]